MACSQFPGSHESLGKGGPAVQSPACTAKASYSQEVAWYPGGPVDDTSSHVPRTPRHESHHTLGWD